MQEEQRTHVGELKTGKGPERNSPDVIASDKRVDRVEAAQRLAARQRGEGEMADQHLPGPAGDGSPRERVKDGGPNAPQALWRDT